MAIKFNCPKCGQELNVKDEMAGKAGKCPRCKATVTVPSIVPSSPRSIPGPVRKRADDVEEIEEVEEVEEVEVIEDDDRPRKSSRTGKKKNDFDFTEEDAQPGRKKRSRRDEEEEEDDRVARRPRKASARRRDEDDYEDEDEGSGSEKRKKALARQRRAAWKRAGTGVFLDFISMCVYTGAWGVILLSYVIFTIMLLSNSRSLFSGGGFVGILGYLADGLFIVSWILFVVGGAFLVTTPGKNGEMGIGIAALATGAVALLFYLYIRFSLDFAVLAMFSGGMGMGGGMTVVVYFWPMLELARLTLLGLFKWAVAKSVKDRSLADSSLMLSIIIPSAAFGIALFTWLIFLVVNSAQSRALAYFALFLIFCELAAWVGALAWFTMNTMRAKEAIEDSL